MGIVPFLYIADPHSSGRSGQIPVAEYFWKMLGVPFGEPYEGANLYDHVHPPIEEDISADLLTQFREVLYKDNGADDLAAVFVNQTGAHLFGYSGSPDNTNDITAWLDENW